MKYITLLESESSECQNIGTITTQNIEYSFKKAIEAHFDADLVSFRYAEKEVLTLEDCINSNPIEVFITIDSLGERSEHKIELSQTWIY